MPLCSTCSGDQVILCPECHGERGDWDTGGGVTACDTCQGRGVLPCPTCDGTGEAPAATGEEPRAGLEPRTDADQP